MNNDPMIGRIIRGTIEVQRLIGQGSMGRVYEGYQAHLDRRLALKVMTPAQTRLSHGADFFFREARSASRLRHQNIIQIIDFGEEPDGTLFLAMEFVPGRPLSAIIEKGGPMRRGRILGILTQVLNGLEEAHAHGVVHRDLKPDNIMIETTMSGEDFVKILDFGIATLDKQDGVDPARLILGSPHYMSPEQARAEAVDSRADLYSVGAILYDMMTGEPPFMGSDVREVLAAVRKQELLPPSMRWPGRSFDEDLEQLCLKATRKAPGDRFQTALAFRLALERLKSAKAEAMPNAFIFKRTRTKTGLKPLPAAPSAEASKKPANAPNAEPTAPKKVEEIPEAPPVESARVESPISNPAKGETSPVELGPIIETTFFENHGDSSESGANELPLVGREDEVERIYMMFDALGRAGGREWKPPQKSWGGAAAASEVIFKTPRLGSVIVISGNEAAEANTLSKEALSAAKEKGFYTASASDHGDHPQRWLELYHQWLTSLSTHFAPTITGSLLKWKELGLGREYLDPLQNLLSRASLFPQHRTYEGNPLKTYQTRALALAQASFRALLRLLSREHPIVLRVEDFQAWDDDLLHFIEGWNEFTRDVRLIVIITPPPLPADISLDSEVVHLPVEPLGPDHGLEEVRARIFAYPRACQNILAVLSVMGNGALADDLVAVCSSDWAPRENLDMLLGQGVVRRIQGERKRLAFAPPSMAGLVYGEMPESARRSAHTRVASLLSQRVAASASPRHLLVDRVALSRQYLTLGRVEEAVDALEPVLDELDKSWDIDHARALLEPLIELLENEEGFDASRLGRFRLLLARQLQMVGEYREATTILARVDRSKIPALTWNVEMQLENIALWMQFEDPKAVSEILDEMREDLLFKGQAEFTPGQRAGLNARALYLRALILERTRRPEQAKKCVAEAISLVEEHLEVGLLKENPWGPGLYWEPLQLLGKLQMKAGLFRDGARCFEQAREVSQNHEDPGGLVAAIIYQAELFKRGGGSRQAEDILDKGLAIACKSGNLVAVSALHYERGHLLKHQANRRADARGAFIHSLQLAVDLDWTQGIERTQRSLDEFDGIMVDV